MKLERLETIQMKLIAEFCQNHLGDRGTLKEMIAAAASSGATHGKIQALYSEELQYREEFEPGHDNLVFARPFDTEVERLAKLDLSREDEQWFVEECHSEGLVPMISVFTYHGLDRAIDAGFESLKIASYDCESLPLIEGAVSASKEVVVSTGATKLKDVGPAAKILRESSISATLLHAKTLYPNTLQNLNIMRMIQLSTFGVPVGLSDHSITLDGDVRSSLLAVAMGASCIERHFTILDKSLTKDGPVSVTPEELSQIAEFSRLSPMDQQEWLRDFLVDSRLNLAIEPDELSTEENSNRLYYRGRVVSTHNGQLCYQWEPCSHA